DIPRRPGLFVRPPKRAVAARHQPVARNADRVVSMPLESIPALMQRAREGGYAVGYFESWSLESLYGVIEAAEQARAPVIIGFNGEFLSRAERTAPERLLWYGALGKAAATDADIPCGFIFNECSQDDWTRAAVTAGFNL